MTDEISPYKLFKMSKGTFDPTDFGVEYRDDRGIDMEQAVAGVSFDMSEEGLVALIEKGLTDPKKADEYIEDNILEEIKAITISDVSEFMIDGKYLDFDDLEKKPPKIVPKKNKTSTRRLSLTKEVTQGYPKIKALFSFIGNVFF